MWQHTRAPRRGTAGSGRTSLRGSPGTRAGSAGSLRRMSPDSERLVPHQFYTPVGPSSLSRRCGGSSSPSSGKSLRRRLRPRRTRPPLFAKERSGTRRARTGSSREKDLPDPNLRETNMEYACTSESHTPLVPIHPGGPRRASTQKGGHQTWPRSRASRSDGTERLQTWPDAPGRVR